MMKGKRTLSMVLAASMAVSMIGAAPAAAEGITFTDVPEDQWYVTYVQQIAEKGLMTGKGNGKFDPEGTSTRAEFVQSLYAYAGKPETDASYAEKFNDLTADWYKSAVAWAVKEGVTAGKGNGFAPDDTVTRAEIAMFLYAYAGKPAVSGELTGFADVESVPDWAETAMLWATQNKIVSGSKDGNQLNLNAENTATRAEVAAMLLAFVKYQSEQKPSETTPAETEEPASAYYVLKNVSFADFYASLKDEGDVDAVSSATAQKAASCKNVYYAETPAIENGTTIEGVVVPVKVDELAEGETALEETPAFYLEETADGYTYVGETSVVDDVEATISTNGTWGNYIVILSSDLGQGTYMSTNRMTGEQQETTINGVLSADVYGAYFTTTDGAQYALKQSENLWTPNDYYEFGIYSVEGSTDIHGAAQPAAYYSSIEGKTIASVTYLTAKGIITANFAEGLYCAPQYDGEITAEMTSDTTVAVSGIPADAENVTVTVGTSGRGRVILVENAAIVDGVVTLDTAASENTPYTVTVNTSNYASMGASVTYTAPTTYTGTATAVDVEEEFTDYDVTVSVAVANDKIVSVAVTGYGDTYESGNDKYTGWATEGRKMKNGTVYTSILTQLAGKSVNDTLEIGNGIDAVSGATCTSKAIVEAVNNALAGN